jgi:hypothetical protein
MLLGFAEWLAANSWSIALHESLYMYPLIESAHVLTICLFLGTLAVVDLRLLGVAYTDVPVPQMTARMLPWTVFGFVLLVITGLLLFFAIPVRTYQSVWFRAKVILLIAAGINMWLFHRRVQRDVERWGGDATPPRAARVSAAISLSAWAGVVITGRLIAYNWFDCDRPQAAFVTWFAECMVDAP